MFKYMLRPAFVPPMTIMGLEFASLLGNAFVVELVFSWPGMASYGVRSILQKDLNAVMGVVMISGVFFVVVNLMIDILVGFIDPRVRIRGARA
jgi:peptide/nickel transport system permease protein